MLIIALYFLMVYGLCNILVFGEGPLGIVSKIRNFVMKYLSNLINMECMICLPTTIGMVLSLLNIFLLPQLPLTPFFYIINNVQYWYLITSCDMFITSGVVWLLHSLQEYWESTTNLNNTKITEE